jgi:outer membrane protein assembly complex protein YaeT
MRRALLFILCGGLAMNAFGQTAVKVPRTEEKDKAQQKAEKAQRKQAEHASVIEFRGNTAFKEKELRAQLKEQITTIDDFGLTAARADDVAFFLEVFYRKQGYAKVNVHYKIESGDHMRLDINEGPLVTLGVVNFVGNAHEPTQKLFEYAIGPTRERYSKLQKNLPFVAADIQEGADLVHRLYVADGFLDAKIDPPIFHYAADHVDVTIPITERQQYFFGDLRFTGETIYGAEALRGQLLDLVQKPYTDARLADIPRRLQGYFKTRGYYDVKVDAIGDPAREHNNARIPVLISIAPGRLYHFGDVTVQGLDRLQPTYVTQRFRKLQGQTYSPEVLDTKFRELMRTGLFNVLQINPTSTGGDVLQLNISAEEAKSKEFGISGGYGSYVGAIIGLQYRDRDLFGYGRPLTTSVEISQRGYKGEVLWEDPYLFDSEFGLKMRVAALTYDFDGYSKFELGGRVELTRKLTKNYEAGIVLTGRHIEVTSAEIDAPLLGDTSYFVNTIGFTQTLDFRDSPMVSPRGLIIDNTFDVATSLLGGQVEYVRSTARVSYYLPFAPKTQTPGIGEDLTSSPLRRWFTQSSLAFGGRVGIIHDLGSESTDGLDLPIDERFFNGGSTTVRSFGERLLGRLERHGDPIGGEFFTVFNAEYTFPIYGELQGAVFADAGNLLASSENPSFDDMRYALGLGLRYRLPIGPIRLDYGFNPNPRPREADGAFHFSFGFAF